MRARSMAVFVCMIGCAKQGAAPAPNAPPAPAGPGAMAPGGAGLVPPTTPPELAVPAGYKLTFMAAAKGVQIYECAKDASGAPAWKLRAPRADLVDDTGAAIGSHYGGIAKGLPPGPYWEAPDGSRVHGAKPVSVANPGSIPLLRLEAADTAGSGVFGKIAFIQRLDTTGGVAPTGACEAGKQVEVPYGAKYYFYSTP